MMGEIQFISVSPSELSELITKQVEERISDKLQTLIEQKNVPKEYLSREETASLLNLSLSGLYKWINQGHIKVFKIGSKPYFKYSDIIELIENSNTK